MKIILKKLKEKRIFKLENYKLYHLDRGEYGIYSFIVNLNNTVIASSKTHKYVRGCKLEDIEYLCKSQGYKLY